MNLSEVIKDLESAVYLMKRMEGGKKTKSKMVVENMSVNSEWEKEDANRKALKLRKTIGMVNSIRLVNPNKGQ